MFIRGGLVEGTPAGGTTVRGKPIGAAGVAEGCRAAGTEESELTSRNAARCVRSVEDR